MWTVTMLVLAACDLGSTPPAAADEDGDGAVAGIDCDDGNAAVHPDAPELCNNVDDDCDGMADEVAADAPSWHADADGDGFGAATSGLVSCDPPNGFVADGTDCDDVDSTVFPGAPEDCAATDRNCDGAAEDGAVDAPLWFPDGDSDGYGTGSGEAFCTSPPFWAAVGGDCDDADVAVFPGATEKCNGVDDDCDAVTTDDDGPEATAWYYDVDDDQYGAGDAVWACEAPVLGASQGGDCNDGNPDIHPGQPEVCDGLDNDCDPLTTDDDAPDAPVWFLDQDGDDFGDAERPKGACAQPVDHVADDTDCNDDDAFIWPGAPEQCNGVDDDCDDLIDDGAIPRDWYADLDGDGFGDPAVTVVACSVPADFVANDLDCDDTRIDVNPAAVEACDDLDTDCDPATADDDAPDAPLWPVDVDGDGFGDPVERVAACELPDGAALDASDCDDADETVYPGAPEACDGVDSDCGLLDEPWPPLFADADGDGFGDASVPVEACGPADGVVSDASDCNDGDDAVFPGAPESCNGGADDDCDPATVDTFDTFWEDVDGDGFGDLDAPTFSCGAPDGYAPEWGDCDVFDPAAWPGAPESCAGGDDCDAATEPVCRFGADLAGSDAIGGVDGLGLGDRLGDAFDAADLDGDGDVELWVSAPGRDAGVSNGGAVWLYDDAAATVGRDSFVALRTGGTVGGMIGDALLLPGDLDGNGVGDLLLGASALGSGGTAMAFVGPLTGTAAASLADATLTGSDIGARAGAAFGAADADGDGVSGWIVGAPGGTGLIAGSGLAYVFAALPLGPSDIGLVASATLLGGAAGAEDGRSVALGDLDGDAIEDAVVGGDADRACVVWGPLSGAMALDDAVAILSAPGAGAAVSTRADLDGDGLVDVLVGAPGGLGGDGAVYGASGLSVGAVDLTIDLLRAIGETGGGIGGALDAADVDGDDLVDLLAGGAVGGSDGARLWYGPLSGVLPEADAVQFVGDEAGEEAGGAVRLVDVDGDTLADVVSASPAWDFFGFSDAGAVFTWSGLP